MGGGMGFYFVASYTEDSDGDGLPNSVELTVGLDILNADTDGDTVSDGDEDMDGDGRRNADEVWVGTDLQIADSDYPPAPLPFGTVFYAEDTFILSPAPAGGFTPAGDPSPATSQDLLFLDAAQDTAHGITAIESAAGTLNVRLHSIYIGLAVGNPSPDNPPPHNNPFPRPTEAELRLLREASGETDIGSGQIGRIRQDLYDQLPEHVLDWASWESEYGLRKTERLLQEIESGQRPASAAYRRALRANLVTQAKRLSAATSSLVRRFARAVGRYLPIIGGIMILTSASAIAEQWNTAFQDYATDVRNGDDTTGSVAVIAAHSNDLAPGSGNFVLDALLR